MLLEVNVNNLYGNLLREYVLYATISKKFDNALLALHFISHCYTLIENMLGLCSLGILESREVNVPLLQCAAVLAGLCANPSSSLNLFLAAAHRTFVTAANAIVAACKKYLSYIRQLFGEHQKHSKYLYLNSLQAPPETVSKHGQNTIFHRAANYIFKVQKVDILTFW